MPFDSQDYFEDQQRRQKKRRKNRARAKQRVVISIIVLLVVISSVGFILAHYFMPNFSTAPIEEFFPTYDKERINVMLGNELAELNNYPVQEGGEIYIPCDFLKESVDKYLFWDNDLERLTVTTDSKVMQMQVEELTYQENYQPKTLDLPILKFDSTAYMPESLAEELYNVKFEYNGENHILTADLTDKEMLEGKITKDTNLRYNPDIKSPIAEKLLKDDKIIIFEGAEDFTKIRTASGLVGYVATKDMEQTGTISPVVKNEEPVPPAKPINGKITLLWDQMFNRDANNNELRRRVIPGLKVLSPTWFSFDTVSLNGDIIDLCDQSYVDRAHQNGVQIWALITDISDDRNVKSGDISSAILSNGEARDHVIRQLLSYVQNYNLDGINIDFENVREKDAECYLQFFRELYPMMKQLGAVLSVDMYVPQAWSRYYNRAEVGKSVDYFCVMAYDEHYAGSDVSGPVASIGFVEEGITNTMKDVPKEKIIMGIPFYDRIWRETTDDDGQFIVSSDDTFMGNAYDTFRNNGVEFQWLEDQKLYYGEFSRLEGGKQVTYKVWLEDERSIDEKLKLALKYDLKGVAFWKRGLEVEGVWDLINAYTAE